jgi:hypothetical protein
LTWSENNHRRILEKNQKKHPHTNIIMLRNIKKSRNLKIPPDSDCKKNYNKSSNNDQMKKKITE